MYSSIVPFASGCEARIGPVGSAALGIGHIQVDDHHAGDVESLLKADKLA